MKSKQKLERKIVQTQRHENEKKLHKTTGLQRYTIKNSFSSHQSKWQWLNDIFNL